MSPEESELQRLRAKWGSSGGGAEGGRGGGGDPKPPDGQLSDDQRQLREVQYIFDRANAVGDVLASHMLPQMRLPEGRVSSFIVCDASPLVSTHM